MNDSTQLLIALFMIPLSIIAAMVVAHDAKTLADAGATINPPPGQWGCMTFLFIGLVLPYYLVMRFTKFRPEVRAAEEERRSHEALAVQTRAARRRDEPIVFECFCGRTIKVRAKLAGRSVACPECNGRLKVPLSGG